MNKRILLILIAMLSFHFVNAQKWEENLAVSFSDSTSSKITIKNAGELALLASRVNSGQWEFTGSISLGTGLDLQNYLWTPIGTNDHPFTWTFDGNNYTITRLNAVNANKDCMGLFGVVTGVVKNVSLLIGSVGGQNNVGALVGLLSSNGSVNGCTNTQVIVTGGENVGGLIGSMEGNTSLSSSENRSGVSGNTTVGGLIGKYTSNGSISSCFNAGNVFGKESVTGGIVGMMKGAGQLSYSYNVAKVSGVAKVGGIAGYMVETVCQNTYNVGLVAGSSYVGNLFGDLTDAILADNYYDNILRSSFKAIGDAGTGKDGVGASGVSSVDLITACTTSPWVATEGMYPRLKDLDASDVAYVYAIPVTRLFAGGTGVVDPKAVTDDFSLFMADGVKWTSDNEAIKLTENGLSCTAAVTRSTEKDIPVTLTVAKGSASNQYVLTVARKYVYEVSLFVRESEKNDISIKRMAGGELLPNNNYQVEKDSSFTFRVNWPDYYASIEVLVNNKPVKLAEDSTFTITDIMADQTVLVKGTLKKYNVAVTCTAGGTISVSPSIVDGKVSHGTKLTLKAYPDELYQFDRWTPTNQRATQIDVVVKSDTAFEAIFIQIPTQKVTFTSDSKGVSFLVSNYPFKVTTINEEVFTENTDGFAFAKYGTFIRFKVATGAQYNTADMKVLCVNGTTTTEVDSDQNGIYQVDDIKSDIKIEVTGVILGEFKVILPDEEELEGGKVVISPAKASYDYGDRIEVRAIADEGYKFEKWSSGRKDSVYMLVVASNMIIPTPVFKSTIPTGNESISTETVNVYAYDHVVYVNQQTNKVEPITIVDMTGNVIVKQRTPDVSAQIRIKAKGIYIVNVGKYSDKVIIR